MTPRIVSVRREHAAERAELGPQAGIGGFSGWHYSESAGFAVSSVMGSGLLS